MFKKITRAAEKMAESKLTSFPVVDGTRKLVGILNIADLLTARGKASLRDSDRKRVLTLRWPFGRGGRAVPAIDHLVDSAMDSADRVELEQVQQRIEGGLD